MIDTVRFSQFKSIEHLELEGLERFSVFVGPNASGKTSVLEGLHAVGSVYAGNRPWSANKRRLAETVRRGAEPGEFELHMTGRWSGESLEVTLEITDAPKMKEQRWSTTTEVVWGSGSEHEKWRQQSVIGQGRASESAEAVPDDLGELLDSINSASLLRLDPNSLARPSYTETEEPTVDFDGAGLATVIRKMEGERPDRLDQLQELLSRVVPNVRAVRTRRAPVSRSTVKTISVDGETYQRREIEEVMGEEILFDMISAEAIPAHAASEGTILTLGLLTVIVEESPTLLLLDDIERALHPRALGELVDVLRDLLDELPELQILATSHSPYLLDHMRPEEIWLTNLDDQGRTVAKRLDEHQEFEIWKDEMSPGEFWSYVGEDWLLEEGDE